MVFHDNFHCAYFLMTYELLCICDYEFKRYEYILPCIFYDNIPNNYNFKTSIYSSSST